MKKALSRLLGLVIALSVTFTGCTNKEIVIPKEPVTEPPTPTRHGCGYYNPLFVWWEQTDADLTLLQDAWYDFREIYTKGDQPQYPASINMFSMSGDTNGTTQLEQQIMAGTAPDLVKMDHVYLNALGQKGLLYDLQDQFHVAAQLQDQFVTSAWEASTSGDAVYGIPFDANTTVFGAKTSVLQQAGVSIPTTYEELQTTAATLDDLEITQKPYFLPMEGYEFSPMTTYFMTWLWRLGGDLLNEDFTAATFQDPETGVKALQMMLKLKKDGILATDPYAEGNTILRDYGTQWTTYFRENKDMEFTLQPALKEGVPRYSLLGVSGLGIVTTTGPDLLQLTYDFAVHLATEQNAVTKEHYVYTYCRNHSAIPALKAAIATKEIWNADSTEGAFWRANAQQLELSKYRPAVSCWPSIEEALTAAVDAALSGEKTPQQALEEAAQIANRLLDEWHKE